MKRNSGFTMIELVVATAIAALLVTGIYSATQSSTAAARRQMKFAREEAKTARAIEIMRRDLRGWNSRGRNPFRK